VRCSTTSGSTRRSRTLSGGLALDIAALRSRLIKDEALGVTGSGRAAALAGAADDFARIYDKAKAAGNPEAYYPGVNAATLYLLAGNAAAATAIAREVLQQLAAWPPERKSYYEVASELEAQLILGELDGARASASAVRARIRDSAQADYRGLSSTVRQLRLIIDWKGLGEEWQAALAPPRVVHFLGHIIAPPGRPGRFPAMQAREVKEAIAERLAARDVGFGYGSLAAGADILFAEGLLDRGASLHVVLPFDREEFIEVSVRPSGDAWVARFIACLERAASVHFATDDHYLGDDHLFGYCSQVAMGLALLRARHLSAEVEQLAVWDGRQVAGPAGTAADIEHWRRTGKAQHIIPVGDGFQPGDTAGAPQRALERRTRAMLFGDIHGFSKLTDAQLPRFIEAMLGTVARVIEKNKADVLLANTWGDGLFLVFDDAGRAASCALALQEALTEVNKAASGLPETMALRIGLHLGPAYTAHDPILLRDNFFGAHVSRAARIEPVTPLGCVYVTETMAAVLALHNADAFDCEYVGMTEAAKGYGQMRMFLLRRAGR
jgi:class 3 adenylate cyclase